MDRAIEVRRPALDLDAAIPRHWYGGQPFATHFMDALSSVFPDGEAFFVRAVLHYRDRVEDPALRGAIAAIAAQEGQHSPQHGRHLDLLAAQGYTAIATRNRFMRAMLRFASRRLPHPSLVSTAALEHLTALLARQLLGNPEKWTGPMDPRMAPLWQWHALEEAEHKSVAFDVLQLVGVGTLHRAWAMAINTLGLLLETLDRTVYMLWKDGLLFRRRTWSEGLRWLCGRGGFLRGLGHDYWRWYRRDFHPDEVDDTRLVEVWRTRIASPAA
jgi:predicted metal-dependent hydrolase